jgi:hypothetical protein
MFLALSSSVNLMKIVEVFRSLKHSVSVTIELKKNSCVQLHIYTLSRDYLLHIYTLSRDYSS